MISELRAMLANAGYAGLAQGFNFLSIIAYVAIFAWIGRRLQEAEDEGAWGGFTLPLSVLLLAPFLVHFGYHTSLAHSIDLVLVALPIVCFGYVMAKFGGLFSNPAALRRFLKRDAQD